MSYRVCWRISIRARTLPSLVATDTGPLALTRKTNPKQRTPPMVDKLEPCPFCKSNNIDPEMWSTQTEKGPGCMNCGATAETIVMWNTRTTALQQQELVELREALQD